MSQGRRWRPYAWAALLIAAAVGVRFLLEPLLDGRAPFALYYPAILVTAWFWGVGPTLFSIALALLSAAYFFVEPSFSLALGHPADMASLVLFLAVDGAITWLARAAARRARPSGARAGWPSACSA